MPDMNDEDQLSARVAKRDSLLLATYIFNEAGRQIGRARVRNVSATGLMAECDATFGEGERIELVLRGVGQITGTISWAREGRIGVSFETPIDPKLVRRPIASTAKCTVAPALTAYTPARFQRPR